MPALPRPPITEELAFLHRMATLTAASDDLDEVLGPVLRALAEQLRMSRTTLALVDRSRSEVVIEAAHGLTPSEVRRGRFALGEGVTGRVAESGEPAAVVRIHAEQDFLDRTNARQAGDASFVCVPIVVAGRVLGTLSGLRAISHPRELDKDIQTLGVVSGLLAPAVLTRIQAQDRQAHATVSDDVQGRFRPTNLIGRSKPMAAAYDLIGQVAGTQTTVLLLGESGTGKELVAQAIHDHSPRASKPFVKVNCAALSETLIESELFGHERGAYTGAHQQRKGRFELADGGTLFLDEIGDLAPQTQIKLLRVLQERQFERVGGNHSLTTDVRVITATSRDLEAMIEEGSFRLDLYYRLNVFPIHLPPLRERRADILLLADHFIDVCNRSHGKQVRRIATSAIDMLMAYHWPGNVRELENCIERAVLLTRDEVILGHHLPPSLQAEDPSAPGVARDLRSELELVERELVLDALKTTRGNMAKAARKLGITERIMGLRIHRFGIDTRRFKSAR